MVATMPHKSQVIITGFGKMKESIKIKPQNVIIIFFFILSAIPNIMGVAKGSDEYRSNIDLAVSYLSWKIQ